MSNQSNITQRYGSNILVLPVIPRPIARITNVLFDNIGANPTFNFTFNLDLKKSDDVTPLEVGDTVILEIRDNLNNQLFDIVEGSYGANISTFTYLENNTNILNYMGGLVVDGGTITFNKKDWANANNYNYISGSWNGTNWDSEAKQLKLFITTFDSSENLWSNNDDNTNTLLRSQDLVVGCNFGLHSQTGSTPFYSYGFFFDAFEQYITETDFQIDYNGNTVQNGLIPLPTIQNFTNTYGLKRRAIHSNFNSNLSGLYENISTFNNGMVAYSNILAYNKTLNNLRQLAGGWLINRNNNDTQWFNAYVTKLESSSDLNIGISPTVHASLPTGGTQTSQTGKTTFDLIEINGNTIDTNIPFTFISSGGLPYKFAGNYYFDLPTKIDRHNIRFQTVENGDTAIQDFQAEINYIW